VTRDRLAKAGVLLLSLAAVAALAALDFRTGYETALSLFYLVPIALTVWFSWPWAAVLMSALGGASDVALTYAQTRGCTPVNVLNAALQTSFFTVFAGVLLALKESRDGLRRLSRTDPLTGLANSRYFFELGSLEVQRSARYKHFLSVVYVDVDDFKSVNDSLGHGGGDLLLREIAATVKGNIRRTDTMARVGGDEFAILLPETNSQGAQRAVERIRDCLQGIRSPRGRAVTFSMGLITYAGGPSTFEDLVDAADRLMYEAKFGGKNAVRAGAAAGSDPPKGPAA
jgi:diguanylate cyclase (GGDEF)-like protein